VRLALDRLSRQGIAIAEQVGRTTLYRLNRGHLAAAQVVGLAHLRHQFVESLRSAFAAWSPQPAAAYLFGSTVRGESTAASDIDICIVRPADVDADSPDWRRLCDMLAHDVSIWTGNDTRILELAEDEVRRPVGDDPLLMSIGDEGIHLSGDDRLLRRRRRTSMER
jgi:predicted nucleotidyltransferase